MSTESMESPLRFVYDFKCQECRYSRHMGPAARLGAESKALKHAHTRHHRVIVWVSDLVTLTTTVHMDIQPKKTDLDLFDQPPF